MRIPALGFGTRPAKRRHRLTIIRDGSIVGVAVDQALADPKGTRARRGGPVRRRTSLELASAIAALLGVAMGVVPAVAAMGVGRFALTGYALEDAASLKAVARDAPRLTTVAVDGAEIVRDGTSLRAPGTAVREAARRGGARAQVVVSNFDSATGTFRQQTASLVLGSAATRRTLAALMADLVGRQGWDGVVIDLEALADADRGGLVDLVRRVRRAVPPGKLVTVALPAFDSAADPGRLPYDAKSIGTIADEVLLMAYAQHTADQGVAGPVGGLPWMERAIAVMTRDVSPKQLRLGIGAYGVVFGPNRTGGDVTVDAARRLASLAGVRPRWDATQGEWTAVLGRGRVVWWSDERSVALRIALARRDTPGGAGIWRLATAPVLSARVVGRRVQRR
ncbi:MAG: hypothetical protein HYX33_02790 [Actinobacteria bacterium]|nr:hypothetical protein [Actinomycetota bacterium]